MGECRFRRIKDILRYSLFKLKQTHEDETFRIYVTDCLKYVTENTARQSSGRFMVARFADILHPAEVDSRTGDEIAEDFLRRLAMSYEEN